MFSIGVVVPLYNKVDHISKCIRSLLAQTVMPALIVVVDDGSSDGSGEVVQQILADYKGVYKIVTQQNQGVSVARNRGVLECNTEFVCFLDADDEWDPVFIERILNLIRDYPSANLYCLGHRVCDQEIGIFVPIHGYEAGFRGYLPDYFEAASRGCVANSSKVAVRRAELIRIHGFPKGETIGEDLFVWMMLALGGRVVCDASICVTVNQFYDVNRVTRIEAVPYPLIYFGKHKRYLTPSVKKYLFRIYFFHMIDSGMRGDFRGGINRCLASFAIFPGKAVVFFPLLFIPRSMLIFIKNIRRSHKKVSGDPGWETLVRHGEVGEDISKKLNRNGKNP